MIFNNYYNPLFVPYIPTINEKPPTIYSLLESIVNFGTDDKTKIKDLAKAGRTTIFNFDYPLSSKISREDFESMILNKFLMRRIGFDTLTAFQIQLNVKLNEIMPVYNKMFDALDGWNIFEDGEKIVHTSEGNRTTDTTNTIDTTNTLENNSTTNTSETSDRRQSELPQSEIDNVKDASYLTNYTYEQNNNNGTDNSTSSGSSNTNGTTNVKDDNLVNEETIRTPADKIVIYKEFIENRNNIYTMIFKDLNCLFYQLV